MNKDQELKGKVQNTGGKAQAAYGDLKPAFKKAVQGKQSVKGIRK